MQEHQVSRTGDRPWEKLPFFGDCLTLEEHVFELRRRVSQVSPVKPSRREIQAANDWLGVPFVLGDALFNTGSKTNRFLQAEKIFLRDSGGQDYYHFDAPELVLRQGTQRAFVIHWDDEEDAYRLQEVDPSWRGQPLGLTNLGSYSPVPEGYLPIQLQSYVVRGLLLDGSGKRVNLTEERVAAVAHSLTPELIGLYAEIRKLPLIGESFLLPRHPDWVPGTAFVRTDSTV